MAYACICHFFVGSRSFWTQNLYFAAKKSKLTAKYAAKICIYAAKVVPLHPNCYVYR